jgi:NADH-ubiquinone oxidoreductase chain 5
MFLPLINFLFFFFICSFLSQRKKIFVKNFFPILLFIYLFLLSIVFFNLIIQCFIPKIIIICPWFFNFNFSFLVDNLSLIMFFIVTFISTLVHLYSFEYMKDDTNFFRFISFLSLFTFFMLMLVFSGNLIQLFLGWEGVGLVSYFLINFWFTRLKANKAALKAVFINRIGDVSLLISFSIIYYYFKNFDFFFIKNNLFFLTNKTITILDNFSISISFLIGIFLLFGVMSKSAQIGLHTWLPDAMEGPTPVSALIHAATMVTAGVFLLLRCNFFFELNDNILFLVTIIGGLTSFFSAIIGVFQHDLKKVIAYSTCSQLGYMVFSCGMSNYSLSLFHLFNHAFFKALLFLSAGCVIHALSDEQDMRKMGGLLNLLPYTYNLILIGSLALTGFPFFSGFYSKDLILESSINLYFFDGIFVFWLGSFAALLTSFYSIRLLFLVFFSNYNGPFGYLKNIHDAPRYMFYSLLILSVFSIFSGFFAREFFISDDFWYGIFYNNMRNFFDSECLPFFIKNIPIIFSIFGSILFYFIFSFSKGFYIFFGLNYFLNLKINNFLFNLINFNFKNYYEFYFFFSKKWLVDWFYNKYFILKSFYFSYFTILVTIDRGLLELIGPLSIIRKMNSLYFIIKFIHSGFLSFYLSFLFFFFILFNNIYFFIF